MMNKILIIDDDATQRHVVSLLLKKKLKYTPVEASSAQEALTLLKEGHLAFKLIILDLYMPGMGGMEFLEITSQQYPDIPVIMLTAEEDIKVAVNAMQAGAKDFLNKPVDPYRFEVSVTNTLKIGLLEKEVTRLKHKEEGNFNFNDLIGYDKGLAPAIGVGRKAAACDIPVLLTGETGVGKEVFAQALHGESRRSGNPFIAVNCGAIPANLVESTLFGHEKGAFTGAVNKSAGCFKEANGGTIFLDEVGELPPEAQVKLLRVLQEKEITPVGASKPVPINVRIISATNRDLEQDVVDGTFRDDLYFRLNVLPILLPPLRERKEDIPYLINHFIERFSISEKRPLKDITDNATKALSQWQWPGNVRELENVVHRATVMGEDDVLDIDDFVSVTAQPSIEQISKMTTLSTNNDSLNMFQLNGLLKTADMIEQESMQFALKYHNGNITKAAESLNMAKSTFYRKLQKQKIQR
jgi:DNA-binding NtrC family response regulator